ncbi:MAG: hypothetical protein SAK29_14595 [Scytonema sp. PMC 1069.18]|nr:hypothetical protein [Scytonema sp. PMC 1069.18]MEC4885407.1 hypothetical protein [Scytonema sp. PMC 1070.18]
MKTIEDLRTRVKKLSKQASELMHKATELCLTDMEQARLYRQQARVAIKRCEVLRQELIRRQAK